MRHLMSTRNLADALKAEGFAIPENCAEARLIMGPNDPFVIEYRVFVDGANLDRLGRALQRLAQEELTRKKAKIAAFLKAHGIRE